jgi:hypothetical protein
MVKTKILKFYEKREKLYLMQDPPDVITEFITFSVESCRCDPIQLPRLKHKGQFFPLRAQLHTLLLGDFGQFKSTRLKTIPEKHSFYLQDATAKAFVGSITDKNEPAPSVLGEAAGKVFILDEIHNLKEDSRTATLALLEDQFYNRAIGARMIRSPISHTSKDGMFSVEAYRNVITIRARFSCVAGGLPLIQRRTDNDWAWFSRFATLRFKSNTSDVYRGLRDGFSSDDLKNVMPFPEKNPVSFPAYGKFLDLHEKLTGKLAFLSAPTIEQLEKARKSKHKFLPNFQGSQSGMLGRNALETIRIAALYALKKKRTEINDDDYLRALELAPLLLYNIAALNLSQTEYIMLSRIMAGDDLTKIAQDLEFSDEYLRMKAAEFKERGLIP